MHILPIKCPLGPSLRLRCVVSSFARVVILEGQKPKWAYVKEGSKSFVLLLSLQGGLYEKTKQKGVHHR